MEFNTVISKFKNILNRNSKSGGDASGDVLNKNKAGSLTSSIKKPLLKTLGKYCYNYEKVLGLEISPHYIRICQMTNSYGRWSLNQLASACMENQFTNMDIELNQELYVENLKALIQNHHIKTKDAALSIPTSASIIKILNIPNMEEEDLDQAASMGGIWESMVQLSGGINEYSVYYKILRRRIKPSESFTIREELFLESNISAIDESKDHETINPTSPKTENGIVSSFPEPIESLPDLLTESEPEGIPPQELLEEENTMDVLFVATRLADAMLYMDIAQRAGLNPIIMDAKCNAIKHAFETNPEKHHISQPYALLEFGVDENYIYIIEKMAFATFNINISDEDKLLIRQGFETTESLNGFINNFAAELQKVLD